MEASPRLRALSLFASHLNKAIVLAGNLFNWLEQEGSIVEETKKKVEEL